MVRIQNRRVYNMFMYSIVKCVDPSFQLGHSITLTDKGHSIPPTDTWQQFILEKMSEPDVIAVARLQQISFTSSKHMFILATSFSIFCSHLNPVVYFSFCPRPKQINTQWKCFFVGFCFDSPASAAQSLIRVTMWEQVRKCSALICRLIIRLLPGRRKGGKKK